MAQEPLETVTPLRITCPSVVVSSMPFECRLTIATRARAPDADAPAAVRLTLPPGIFHVANSANARFDPDTRQLALPLDRLPSDSHVVSISLIADDAGAGRTRTLTASIPTAGRPAPVEADVKTPPRDAPGLDASTSIYVAPGAPLIAGAFEAPRAPLTATAGVLVAMMAALFAVRRRRRGKGRAFHTPPSTTARLAAAIGVLVSLFVLFLCMPAWIETVRARTVFVATTCTIVDRGSSGLAPQISYVPMAVVRYTVEGVPRLSSGFALRGTMYGSADPLASRSFAVGGQYPCWYDPVQPERVVLRREPGFVAWFALLPAAVLAITLAILMGAVANNQRKSTE